MTEKQYSRACEIQSEIKGIKQDLGAWNSGGRQEIVSPISLRLGGSLEHTPKEAFNDFKIACITGLNKRLEELLTEFGNL
jgi:hypothetical protein